MSLTPAAEVVRAFGKRDAVLALFLATAILITLLATGYSVPEAVGGAALYVPLAWRSRFPLRVLGAVAVGSVAFLVLVKADPVYVPAVAVSLYAVAVHGSRLRTLALGAALVPVVILLVALFSPDTGSDFVQARELIIQLGFALAVGEAVRSGRALLETSRQRTELETRRRMDEERVRIARDVHDVVSHSLATINTQASVGVHVSAQAPERSIETLRAIKEVSTAALADLRRALGSLRDEETEPPVEPTPTLREVPALVDRARVSGLPVTLRMEGSPVDLPPAVELAAFRIVQEGLTNAMRHAKGASVTVRIAVREERVEIEVTDDGAEGSEQPSGDPGGSGLLGMRERTIALGGEFESGATTDGGFRVRAVLPGEAT